jgi:protein-S-isoprenylcysteine O-methyltransferase Ste14
MSEIPDHAQVRVAPRALFAVFLVAALWLDSAFPLPLGGRGVAAVALALWLLLGFSALLGVRQRHTSVSPYRPATALITDGPYGLSRNPSTWGSC